MVMAEMMQSKLPVKKAGNQPIPGSVNDLNVHRYSFTNGINEVNVKS